jgi:hypothetical protein
VLEHGGTKLAVHVLVQDDAISGASEDAREHDLASFQRLVPQVLAIECQEIKAIGEHVLIDPAGDGLFEVGRPVFCAEYRLGIDDEHPRLEPFGLSNERKAPRPVITPTREETDAIALTMNDFDAKRGASLCSRCVPSRILTLVRRFTHNPLKTLFGFSRQDGPLHIEKVHVGAKLVRFVLS